MATEESYIEIKDFSFTYPESSKRVLKDIRLSVKKGDFLLLMGNSGSGKTTLLRQLKPAIAPHGTKMGSVLIAGEQVQEMSAREQAEKIGFVMQIPENQIVTDKTWHELAFSMENLGFHPSKIRSRVAEMASFFGIQEWFHKDVSELSGGQKQKLALASIMTLNPDILLLDEPTSQLDPIAANEFLRMVEKIHKELGVTVIMIEHRLEEVLPMVNKIAVLENGEMQAVSPKRELLKTLKEKNSKLFWSLPASVQAWWATNTNSSPPISIQEGKKWFNTLSIRQQISTEKEKTHRQGNALSVKNLWFRYEQHTEDILRGVDLSVEKGTITAIVGGNGTGKSTFLSVLSGVYPASRGEITFFEQATNGKRIATLPQNPRSLFTQKTVLAELSEMGENSSVSFQKQVEQMVRLCDLQSILDNHPFDLSGGEQQRVALAKLLLLQPTVLLLDEPTKAFDGGFKKVFATILEKLKLQGITILMVSHDLEFVAEIANNCALFFDGKIVSSEETARFFSENQFYTTSANLIAREKLPTAITAREIVTSLGEEYPVFDTTLANEWELEANAFDLPEKVEGEKWSNKRSGLLAFSLVLFMLTSFYVSRNFDGLKTFLSGGAGANLMASDKGMLMKYGGILFSYIASMLAFFTTVVGKKERKEVLPPLLDKKEGIGKYSTLFFIITLVLTVFLGARILDVRNYALVSNLALLEVFLFSFLSFERKKIIARKLVMIAVLISIAVASRVAFFMLPQFKPMLAIVILSGIALGGEVGFITGAMSAIVSNIFFGQGPWTAWQMLSFALIGWLAGWLHQRKILSATPLSLAIFGGLSALFLYGVIMNISNVLIMQAMITKEMLIASLLQGLPFDLVHALATTFFLYVGSDGMLEKIHRTRKKYGI
ncbi:energy-coupling factor transport system ATP-binding protein [Pilibacter termitis]|uniref:Energy-coupling factor transport system ATP-binding protein n=1 Tax=Pilibacter termitis TaxID=263852 RepID=A0A1T4K5C4_9ENTE|nr:ATP-binding cassette domain-containing protein [Pilibacter termitis]SJZ37634.1 energy-coupling factor transport system ATP-binding protein [Pilibacter termitis]